MEEQITFYAVLWLYEDIINDILGLRNHIILNSYDKPYRYSITPKILLEITDVEGFRFIPYSDGKTQRELEKLRKKAVASQMRYDQTKQKKDNHRCVPNHSAHIIYHALSNLAKMRSHFLEDPSDECHEKEISNYYKTFVDSHLSSLWSLYNEYAYMQSGEKVDLLTDGSTCGTLLHRVMQVLPATLLPTMYHYFCFHQFYSQPLFDEFDHIVNTPSDYTCFKCKEDVEGILKKMQTEMEKPETVSQWHQYIYDSALRNAQNYPSLRSMIPKEEHIRKLMKSVYKKWEDMKIERWNFQPADNQYLTIVKQEVYRKAIFTIPKNGFTDQYKDRCTSTINLRTLYNTVFPFLVEAMGLNQLDSYTCPDFLAKVYFKQLEDVHSSKIHKCAENFHQNDPQKEKMGKLYTVLLIACAFDDNMSLSNSQPQIHTVMTWFEGQLKNKTLALDNDESKFIKKKLIKEILNKWVMPPAK